MMNIHSNKFPIEGIVFGIKMDDNDEHHQNNSFQLE
jgi:hypothetical protein